MISKKRILFLLTRMPYPATDGTRAKILHNILNATKGSYDCTIAIVSDEKLNPRSVSYLEEHYGKIKYFYVPRWRRAIIGLFYWLCGYPLQTGYFYSNRVAEELAADMASAAVIYAHTIRVGKYFDHAVGPIRQKTIFDFNDAISYNYATAKKYASFWWRIIYALELSRVVRYEKKMLSRFAHCAIVSEADKDYIGDAAGCDVRVIRHGVADELVNRENNYDGTRDTVFMGNIFYPPNRDSVVWFSKFLKEKSMSALAKISYDVIGRHPLGFERSCPSASFSGFLDDPYGFMLEHKVFVSPLRFGGGVPTKILEAMALGMAVITTPEGARSIEGAKDGENIVVRAANDKKGWMAALALLLNDPVLREKIGRNARILIREKYLSSLSCVAYGKYFDEISAK